MSARDFYHGIVKEALEKEGWKITHDPYYIPLGRRNAFIDLAAEEHLMSAEKEGSKIAVEIKSFLGKSTVNQFHKALGQVLVYQVALEQKEADREFWLAIPLEFSEILFDDGFFEKVLEKNQIKVLIFDEHENQIREWKAF